MVIIDEAQNYYFDELKKVLTRLHDSCKIIVIGHEGQNDLFDHPERSGFVPYLNWFAGDDRTAGVPTGRKSSRLDQPTRRRTDVPCGNESCGGSIK